MREENIEKMSFKELRAEVQLLRDELAIFKRKYEDAIYNLDSDNFGKSFTVEQNNMKAQIKISADAIKTMVSDTDLQSALENYSTITQTANAIQTVVSKGANLDEAIPITSLDQATDTTAVYVIQSTDSLGNITGERYYYYNDLLNQWEILSGDSIYTVFNQTASGFELKGNVLIDGNTVITKNLTLSGNVTWDMENSPVLTRYSSDNLNWHSPMADDDMYMQMSFDGGVNWSTSTKVAGTDGEDGRDGWDGSDANVTPMNVFNALTDDGASQGIFAAFVNNNNQLYINAEYLATRIAEVADTLYIGDSDTLDEKKSIYFNDRANITTFINTAGYVGIAINSNGFQIHSKPADIEFIAPDGSSFTTGSISLEDYIAEYAGGSGSGYAIFG